MKNEKYIYFVVAGATMAFDNHTAQTLQLTTGGFANPVPTGANFIANGGLKVTVTSHATNQTFGTYYSSFDTSTGAVVEIHPSALTYDGTDTITIATAAADPVYGWTKSSTGANNDLVVTQLKPYEPGDAIMVPASKVRGIQVKDADETYIYTEAMTGDGLGGGARDTITITHGSAKFKELAQMINDIIADPRQNGEMIVVADLMSNTFFGGNPAGITAVAYSLDT